MRSNGGFFGLCGYETICRFSGGGAQKELLDLDFKCNIIQWLYYCLRINTSFLCH